MIPTGRRCSVAECRKLVVAKGLCQTHYMRQNRHGHLYSTRPTDWGNREKHPLIGIYRSIIRLAGETQLCAEWKDFWQFVKDVGEKKRGHRFTRIDRNKVFSKGNVYWSATEPNKKSAEYAKEWRGRNPEYALACSLRRSFKLSVEDYKSMWTKQNGRCKLCDRPESALSSGTGRTRRLSVDHCHESGKIRELLCGACNSGLGNFKDDPVLLEKAAEYLRNHSP